MAEISLATLAHGAVAELFDEELRKVGENILDINTDAKTVRKLRIELEFKPEDDDRREGAGACESRLSACALQGREDPSLLWTSRSEVVDRGG